MPKSKIGIIGMSTMGSNLALNIESRGYSVSIFNRSNKKTEEVTKNNPDKKLIPCYSLYELVESLEKPRCIILMIKSGSSIDEIIKNLKDFLEKGDIIIDCGNSFFQDTIRRDLELSKDGFHFIGIGISGGHEGALKGPSIMSGGKKEVYDKIFPILHKIAAIAKDGKPCVAHVGPNGAGHYVKMVHNGIEYGFMQLISEIYFLLKNIAKLSNEEMAYVFNDWNSGELSSYLIKITKNILTKKNEDNNYILDLILDEANNKGTGVWTIHNALELNEPLSVITESVFARFISSIKIKRVKASKLLTGPLINIKINKTEFIEKLRRALYISKIITYAQGFSQLHSASVKYQWDLDYAMIAEIFREGCIIRAKILQKIMDTYHHKDYNIDNLLLSPYFMKIVNEYQYELRETVIYALKFGIPVPALSAAINYYDSYRTATLPANLIQAQRDYFGEHYYKCIDKEENHIFHTEW